jgi:F-box interacting protein
MNCLPRELMEEVFLRLPVSCLLQCVGVCKMWRGIIRDSKFAAAHLEHAPSCTLLFSPQGSMRSSGNLYPSDAIFFDEAWSPSTWAVLVIGPDDVVCGSCNGLLYLYMPTSTIKIANLTTGEYLHLQKPVKGLKDDHFSYRFGFHPATKEYKVIHFFHDSGTYTGGNFNVIQVYTLGDDEWKEVITSKDLSLNCVKNSGVVIVDGTVYWLNEELGTNWQHVVMSFDLDDESFAQIQLPEVDLEHYIFGSFRHYWITEIDKKVCVSTAPCISNVDYRIFFGKVQVWALNKAVDQRWSQKYSIQLRAPFNLGLHFVHGNKIMIQCWDNNLYSYELLQKNFEIEPSKVVKLLDLSPRGEYQSYASLMSLVRLDVYARAAIVGRPMRPRGWKLKKWKVWENEFSMMDKLWKSIHRLEHEVQVF